VAALVDHREHCGVGDFGPRAGCGRNGHERWDRLCECEASSHKVANRTPFCHACGDALRAVDGASSSETDDGVAALCAVDLRPSVHGGCLGVGADFREMEPAEARGIETAAEAFKTERDAVLDLPVTRSTQVAPIF